MLKLKVSSNLGVSYKDIEQFENLLTASDYLRTNKDALKKKRWIIEDETGFLPLVCSIFEETVYEVKNHHASISDDKYLRRYLAQRLNGDSV